MTSARRLCGRVGDRLDQWGLCLQRSMYAHPRVIACALSTTLLGVIGAVLLVLDVGLSFGKMIPVMSGIDFLVNASIPGIGLALAPVDIDFDSSSMTLNWWPTGCNRRHEAMSQRNLVLNRELSEAGCGQSPDTFAIWADTNPYYTWNASDALLHADDSSTTIFTPQQTFTTSHNFTWISVNQTLANRRQHSVSAWYPYDRYTASTVIETFSDDFSALPIYFLHLYGGISGYNFRIETIRRVTTPRTSMAVYIVFSIDRCIGVKAFAIALFLTNYILAAAMVWVAVCAHLGRPLPESALFLPLTNVLLLPQLRSAMPGVPDFGTFMDIFGYGVNLVAIVIAAMFVLFKIIGHHTTHHSGDVERCHTKDLTPLSAT